MTLTTSTTSMNGIDATFVRLRSCGQRAFIPFLTAGDPDVDGTFLLAQRMAAEGADLLEIGFPYSDPIADGPVIQSSYTRALARGIKLDSLFALTRRIADALPQGPPLVAMTSYSLIHRRGIAQFLDQALDSGFAGAIVPDLPVEESGPLAEHSASRNFKLIQLVTPTTPADRAKMIAQRSTGFLYCVSVAGITGERSQLPTELLQQLDWLRTQTTLPLCVGFGVSRPEHVHMLREHCDGVIVGSALMRQLESVGDRPFDEIVDQMSRLARELVHACRQ